MELEFCGYRWLTRQPWGDVHPKTPFWWYDPGCVEVLDNTLRLQTRRNHRVNTEGIESAIGVGLISSVDGFLFGDFEAEVMLPRGNSLWPAFWLWGTNSWPPEIDVFEGYSGKRGFYADKLVPYLALQSNVWWGVGDRPENTRGKSHMIWRKFDEEFINFRLEWRPHRIEIFYNGKSVRKVTDTHILNWYSKTQLRVVFNNGIQKLEDYKNDSVMLVKNFKYKSYL